MSDNVTVWERRYTIWQECNGVTVHNTTRANLEPQKVRDHLPSYAANNAAAAIRVITDKGANGPRLDVCQKTIGDRVYRWKIQRTV